MGNRKVELLEEISQLLEQYRREVPGRRRAWPESIKNRVLDLRSHGLNIAQISKQTGLPYYTVLKWQHEKKSVGFEQLRVVANCEQLLPANESRTAADIGSPQKVVTVTESTFQPQTTVTLNFASGIRLEGITLSFLLELLPRLGVEVG